MYSILTLKTGREKSILHQHPWIFSGAVQQLPQAENGDIIEVRDIQQKLGKNEIKIDDQYWFHKIQKAYQLRQHYLLNTSTNAYRLLFAEGDFIPGVIVDVYDKVAVMQLLIKGSEKISPILIQGIEKLGIQHIYLKTKENSQVLENIEPESAWLTKAYQEEILIRENNLRFPVDVKKGQKTGFFLDQRENRNLLKQYSQGKKILNAFSYTGGFSVYALSGGATEVHSVDISKDAIAMGNQSIQMNFGENAPHQSFTEDCFDFLKKAPNDLYDIIILDPPAFAKNKKSLVNASRGYISLNELGFRKVKSGGLVFTFSCSGSVDRDLFRKIVFTAAYESGRNIRIIHQLTQPLDHPVNIYHPEGEYLKGLVLYVE
jgi:23S rRNA (cytosine1962-C5)-methyltransferase